MSNLVIVAIPAEDDYVWKISSEKKPHMTLLFLGDIEGKPVLKIQQFLEHAVNILEIGPFWMDVDYRGTLGVDQADVVFFRKDWNYNRIAEFRGQLLKNTAIKTAYDSTEQFPEWSPHLTLGYPKDPAKKDTRDFPGIHSVEFDRIALWYGDFEGPEFRLTHKYNFEEVAMSTQAEAGAAFLAHFGVKGMKWGVRRESTIGTTTQIDTGVVRRQTKVTTTGGESQPAHGDAVKAAVQQRKFKKSGAAALSNQELRELAQRIQLEEQVKSLTTKKGRKFATRQLESAGQQQLQKGLGSAAARGAARAGKAGILFI